MAEGFTKGKGKKRKFIPKSNFKKNSGEIIPPESNHEKLLNNSKFAPKVSVKINSKKVQEKTIEFEAKIARLHRKKFDLIQSSKIKQKEFERKRINKKIKMGVKASSMIISSFEPHFAGICLSYKFAKFGYEFTKKYLANYRITNSWNEAFLNTIDNELQNTVLSLLENKKFKKVTEIVTQNLYEKFLSTINVKVESKYEVLIKRSMTHSINNLIFNNPSKVMLETEFTRQILENYIKNMFIENSTLNYDVISSSKFETKLSQKIILDIKSGKINQNLCLANSFNGTEWVDENVPTILDLVF